MHILRQWAFVLPLCLLAACGGGGGGGGDPQPVSSGSGSSGTSGSEPTITGGNGNGTTTIQPPSTTNTYNVSSASANFNAANGVTATSLTQTDALNAGGGINTVTATTDASGHVTSASVNIVDANGITFKVSNVPVAAVGSFTLAQLSAAIQNISNSAPGSFGFLAAGLNSSFFGGWIEKVDASNIQIGSGAGGNETPVGSMPISGVATYNGQTFGTGATLLAATGMTPFAFIGNASVSADFGKQTVGVTFSNLVTQNLVNNSRGALANISGTGGAISGNKYSVAVSGGGLSGNTLGTFYGSAAQETAGVWQAAAGNTIVQGSFAAKQ
jgi:hypothetical protein